MLRVALLIGALFGVLVGLLGRADPAQALQATLVCEISGKDLVGGDLDKVVIISVDDDLWGIGIGIPIKETSGGVFLEPTRILLFSHRVTGSDIPIVVDRRTLAISFSGVRGAPGFSGKCQTRTFVPLRKL